MMTKTQSKKMNQLKYLVLIPVLISMLFYTSCSDNETDKLVVSKKELQTRYFELNDGFKISKSEKETYLDSYLGSKLPNWKEITYDDLSFEEREEFDVFLIRVNNSQSLFSNAITYKLFKAKNGRNVIAKVFDFSKMKLNKKPAKKLADGSFSVIQVEKAPIFPGCKERNLDCFFKKLEAHFRENFDKSIVNNLGLSSGKTKVFVSFNIDLKGEVSDIKVRAPHTTIKDEVVRVINILPKMTVGENDGKPVKVKYTLPFSFVVN